jgi:hypothetical protein
MDRSILLEELKQVFEKLGVELREQALESEAGKAKSGLVRVRDTKIVLLDSSLSMEEKISILTRILEEFNLEGLYLSPYLRKWMEDNVKK